MFERCTLSFPPIYIGVMNLTVDVESTHHNCSNCVLPSLQRFYQVPSLQDLFKTVKPEVVLEFLKAAALYRPL